MIMKHYSSSPLYLFSLTENKASFVEIHCLFAIFECAFLLTSKPGNSCTYQKSVQKRPSRNRNNADDWSTFLWYHIKEISANINIRWFVCHVQIFKYRDGRMRQHQSLEECNLRISLYKRLWKDVVSCQSPEKDLKKGNVKVCFQCSLKIVR